MDKKRFELYGYYTGHGKDSVTDDARKCFYRFVEDIHSFDELCGIIRNGKLHILIYPEIGMDQATIRLASLRLAAVQCASWGHCDTSGLPTIDYYLSSDLMEPPDADEHYTEQLIRFPNLSVYYTPVEIQPSMMDRETIGLSRESILYLCSHALPTHLPQYDYIYTRIAQQMRDCRFLFLSHYKNNPITEQFRSRICEAFSRVHLDWKNYLVFLPNLNQEDYLAVSRLSDIFLDTMEWSGCNSSFEAIACNLPIITLPGKLMRGRHSAAILTMMGMTDTIASDVDEYIALAVRLGQDFAWRKKISKKISETKHLIYRDRTCVAALEAFFERVVKERQAN